MSGRCKEQVWNGYTIHLCLRKDWKDGFCKQHHPDSVKKRREDADARYKAKLAAVAETQYQAKLAEDTALQDWQRWQREEIARLRLENERLREALGKSLTHEQILRIAATIDRSMPLESAKILFARRIEAALRREDV